MNPASDQSLNSSNRRGFLKHSSLLLAGGAAALVIPRGVHADGDDGDTIKIGLVGCGGRGSGAVLDSIRACPRVKLVAMGDLFADNLDMAYQNFLGNGDVKDKIDVPKERQFVGFDAYQKVLDAGIDLVILATPPGFRPLHFEAAVRSGKHVFMEKPVATDAPGVRSVLATAEEAKRKNLAVGVGLQRRHKESYIETIKRLQAGAIGDIQFMRLYWNGATVWVHRREDLKAKNPGLTEMEYQIRNWYYFVWLCGDNIVEQHIHNLDIANWLLQGYPVRAQGTGGAEVRRGLDYGEIFDHHTVEYEYANGVRVFSQCRQIPGSWEHIGEYVHGTQGTAKPDGLIFPRKGDNWRFKGTPGHKPELEQEHFDLVESIRSGKPINEAEYGAKSTMTAILGRMCTYTGVEWTWEDAFNSTLSYQPDQMNFSAKTKSVPGPDGLYPRAIPGVTKFAIAAAPNKGK